jgi:uncharacterized iron-regulated protein
MPLTLLSALALAACAQGVSGPPGAPGPPWESDFGRDHPLTGRIWLSGEARFVAPEEAAAIVAEARYVLLGEKHDNADHHRIQAWLVAELIARGRAPAVAFEMLTAEQEPALRAHLAERPRDSAGIGPAVGWDKSGWPEWSRYEPIARAALAGGAPLVAASLPRRLVQEIAKEGPLALGRDRVEALRLEEPLPRHLRTLLRQEIIESHCFQLPMSMIDPLVNTMITRDAVMAEALMRAAALSGRDGAVLIGGNGHARRDHGVPYQLGRLAPAEAVVSVGLVEVAEGESDPAAYGARFGIESPPFDVVWFTPAADRDDPCETFADQLRRAKERHEQQQSE